MKIINLKVIEKNHQGTNIGDTINGCTARLKTSNGSEMVELISNAHTR